MAPDAPTRRRFLVATAAASVAAGLAGCNDDAGGGDGAGGDGGTPAGTATAGDPRTGTPTTAVTATDAPTDPDRPADFEGYPYGVGESRVEAARKVMEDAGYGPDERFALEVKQRWWPMLAVDRWLEALAPRLAAAHVALSTDEIPNYRRNAESGKPEAFVLPVRARYPAATDVVGRVAPAATNYHREGARGAPLFWTADSHHGEGRAAAIEAFERIRRHPEPTDRAATVRAGAVRRVEEAVWSDVPLVTLTHDAGELLWHDRVEWTPPGALGNHRKRYHRTRVEGADRLALQSGTHGTLDPVRATDPADRAVVTNVFDGLWNARNATTAADPSLVADYGTEEGYTTYAFDLKSGVRFHDGRELAAGDVVYSLRRVAQAGHVEHVALLADVLGVSHEVVAVRHDDRDEVTDRVRIPSAALPGMRHHGYERERIVPGSLAVAAAGDHRVRLELDRPFAGVRRVLAHPAFSILPAGIVGDVEGHEGEVSPEAFGRDPVGCGPFAFGEWVRGERLSVDRFADYHERVAEVAGVDWTTVEDSGAAFDRFRKDEADVGAIPHPHYDPAKVTVTRTDDRGRQVGIYGPLEGGETVEYAMVPGPATWYLGFNCERVPLAVRRAVASVANVDRLVRERFDGRSLPAYHLTPPPLFPGGPDGYRRHYRG